MQDVTGKFKGISIVGLNLSYGAVSNICRVGWKSGSVTPPHLHSLPLTIYMIKKQNFASYYQARLLGRTAPLGVVGVRPTLALCPPTQFLTSSSSYHVRL